MIGQIGTGWWRFTRYHIRDGYIRPARGAKLVAYNPWKDWVRTRPQSRRSYQEGNARTPYQSLFDLIASLRYRRPGESLPQIQELDSDEIATVPPLSADSEAALVEWCAKWGLLGILPHYVRQVTLSPPKTPAEEARDFVKHFQVQYNWTSRGWGTEHFRTVRKDDPSSRPRVITEEAGSLTAHEGLTVLAAYFPDVPIDQRENFAYPIPLSEPFWQLYSEPVDRFLRQALFLHDAVRLIGAKRPRKSLKQKVLFPFLVGSADLGDLIAPARTIAVLARPTGVNIGWVAPSLLAMLAMMAFIDLSFDDTNGLKSGRSFQCAACGRTFVSRAYQARYCSTRCRWKQQQRNYRAKKRR